MMGRTWMFVLVCASGSSLSLAQSVSPGRIVVSHDVNPLSTSIADTQAEAFAVNCADWMTEVATGPKRLLLFECATEPLRDYSPGVEAALVGAGYDITVTRDISLTINDFMAYDAVFFGLRVPEGGGLSQPDLIQYVVSGGSVYVYGGATDGILDDRDATNEFLAAFGMEFNACCTTPVTPITITGTHPIFDGITVLPSGVGQDVININPADPRTLEVEVLPNGLVVYAVFDGTLQCSAVDLAQPFGVLDLADIDAFISAFLSGDVAADFAPPPGVLDLGDIDAFIAGFAAGCP